MKQSSQYSHACSAILLMVGSPLYTYEVIMVTPSMPIPQTEPSYYTPNRRQAVYLTMQEIAQLDYALRYSLDDEQEFNRRIDDSFIKQVKAACKANNSCDLLKKVLGDFKGKKIRELIFAIGLRISI